MRIFLLLVSLFIGSQLHAQIVVTVAGVLESAGHEDGPVFQSLFNNPHGIAVDSVGNVYVADRFSHYIRRVNLNGTVETIAGTGQPGDQDGPGLQASFNEPWGLCVGKDGNVYIADTRNNLIRKITPDGVVSTLAGSGNYGTSNGQSTSATFGNPTGIEMDDNGNIYVADHLTHIIRKISPSGLVSTLAGSPYTPGFLNGVGSAAKFWRPYGLTVDNQGNILVADEWNHLIRRITPAGAVTTVAGTRVVGHQDGAAESASFNFPWDVTVDADDNIFVADGFNNIIRRITPNENVSTYVGTALATGGFDGVGPNATFSGATAIAYLPLTNEIYIGDAYNHLVRKIISLGEEAVGIQVVGANGDVVCEGEEIQVRAFPETFDQYSFYVDGELIQDSPDEFFSTSNLTPGIHTIQILIPDSPGSPNNASVTVEVLPTPEPTINAIGNTTFFWGDSIILVASFGTSYFWSTGETTATILVKDPGFYTVEVTNDQGCVGQSEEIQISVIFGSDPPNIAFVSGQAQLCHNEVAVLSSNYEEGNQWFVDGWPIEGETAQQLVVENSGTYQVRITDSLGVNLSSTEVVIEKQEPLIIDFIATQTNLDQDNSLAQFTAQVNEAVNYFWDFGDPSAGLSNTSESATPSFNYTQEGAYTVSLIVNNNIGCRDTLIKENYIIYEDMEDPGTGGPNPPIDPDGNILYVPSAFTPNGDGANDVFYIRGDVAEMDLLIFNQWGELFFESTDQDNGWDGKKNGTEVQNGTYVYVLKVKLDNGEEESLTGHVTVIR